MKKCRSCGEDKPLDGFFNSKSSKDGKNSECKECSHKRYKAHYEANKDMWSANYRRWSTSHDRRDYYKEWYRKNREHHSQRCSAYNKENTALFNFYSKRRKARVEASHGSHTIRQLAQKAEYYGYTCWICGESTTLDAKPKDRHRLVFDHVKPIAKGGSDCIANIRPICAKCNNYKRDTWYGVDGLERLKQEVMRSHEIERKYKGA